MRRAAVPLALAAAFLASLVATPLLAPLYARAFPGIVPVVWNRGSLASLAASQIGLVAGALAIAGALGIGAGILATRPAGRAFRGTIESLAVIGQTFPPAAVLALLVPVLGYGGAPTLVALALYALLPITANTIAGIESVPAAAREAAVGIGLSPGQVLWQVELPLARGLILAGLRTATVVGLGTATIGSTVGALTLGTPVIDGLVSGKPNLVLQGALPLALLAVLVEVGFERVRPGWGRGRGR